MGTAKSKRKGRSGSRQKRARRPRTLAQRIQDRLNVKGVVIARPPDDVKMSEVLEAFIQPYLEFATTEESFKRLVATAALAWNASLLPKEKRTEMIDQTLETLPAEVREDGKQVVMDLIQRKEMYFAKFRRAILDFEVRSTKDRFHLTVVSTIEDV